MDRFILPCLELDASKPWCVYRHFKAASDVLWIGVCLHKDVAAAPDAQNNRAWFEHVYNQPNIACSVDLVSATELECNRYRFRLLRECNPICNREYKPIKREGLNKTGQIRCVETGTVYHNASACAAELKVTPAAIIGYLNGTSGARSVKGLTFVRVNSKVVV